MGAVAAEVRIRQEFNESPSQVIRGFADMKVSKKLAAGAMGIMPQTLLRMCRQYGIEFCPRKELVSQCKSKGKGWIKGRKRNVHQHENILTKGVSV